MAAEFGDHEAFLARHGDIVDAGAAGALALDRLRYQTIAKPRRVEEGNSAVLCDRALVVGIAGERKGGIGKREDIAAVTDGVAVDHGRGHRHRQHGMAGIDRHKPYAEAAGCGVVCPHGIGAGTRKLGSVHGQSLRPVNLGGRFSMKARTPSA